VTAARRKPPTKTLAPDGAGRLTPVDAARAEVEAEQDDTGDGSIKVFLADEPIWIKPPGEWRTSAIEALQSGNFSVWARTSLATPEDVETWEDVDPTVSQVEAMLREWQTASGQAVGESRASRRSARSTGRR
jgi:hypothetical protein